MKKSKRILNALTYLFLTIGVVLILFPMYITVVTALKTPDEMSANFFGLPSTLYLGNFDEVIHKAYFGNFVFNSLFITLFRCWASAFLYRWSPMPLPGISRKSTIG